ncbi:hypothetical protein Cni_G15474 [Canna indica]|uniref:Uncharacterized protein n=1 Tax=Canna indica TaxID=4628 RepID=A0AAQ3KG65_9LILI|nr:hypothetical protein Cni_G15474 [Canna indica]
MRLAFKILFSFKKTESPCISFSAAPPATSSSPSCPLIIVLVVDAIGAPLRSLLLLAPAATSTAICEDHWCIVAAELSRKLLHVTRKHDKALLEAFRLKYSLAELGLALERLESHYRDLRSVVQPGPDSGSAPKHPPPHHRRYAYRHPPTRPHAS